MNASEVSNFIRMLNGSNHPFEFFDPKDRKWSRLKDFGAWMASNNTKTICLNQEYWITLQDIEQQCIVAHELGHTHDQSNYKKNQINRELFAQEWAINRFKELQMVDHHLMSKLFLISWQSYKWNSNHRRYILAYKLAKKKKII